MPFFKKIKDGLFTISWTYHESFNKEPDPIGRVDNFPNYFCNLLFQRYRDGVHSLKMQIVDQKTHKSAHPIEFKSVIAMKNGGRQRDMVKRQTYFHHLNDPHSLIWEAELSPPYSGDLTFDIFIETSSSTLDLIKTRKRLKNIHLAVDRLRENEGFGDVVTFKCENETIIRAHPSVLAASSPVFAAMFQHDFKEKKNKIVEITDIKADIFEQLVQYIYIEDAEFQKIDVTELLIAADKYGINSLIEECDLYLADNLTVENATRYLVFAHFHKAVNLFETALEFMARNFKEICFRKEDWARIIKRYPELAIQVTQRTAANL